VKEPNASVLALIHVNWPLISEKDGKLEEYTDTVAFCAAMRKQLEQLEEPDRLLAYWKQNQDTVTHLRRYVPDLKTEKGQHYAEIFGNLFTERVQTLGKVITGTAIGQSSNSGANSETHLPNNPIRIRDKKYLKFVAAKPCLICGRAPCQAHYVTYAQPKALGRKVSDEWAVPLCATHHRSLHDNGNERAWWKGLNIEPIKEAERLWGLRFGRNFSVSVQTVSQEMERAGHNLR